MRTFACIAILVVSLAFDRRATARPIDSVLDRYREFLFQSFDVPEGRIISLVKDIGTDGRWADIDYRDEARADWKVLNHLKRVDTLSIVWSDPSSEFYHQADVWRTISLSLNDWLRHKYQNPNWWHNQIGVPQVMRDILVLLRGSLSPGAFDTAMTVMGQLKVQGTGAGANLIWSADLGFHYGALRGDTVLMDRCRTLILREIHISTGEGIQPDYSFHQHGARLQMYQYGKAFLFSNIRLAWELAGSPWAFPDAKVKLLTDFLFKGWQWMARGINTVPGTMDRSATRIGELRSPDLRMLLPMILELDPEDAASIKALNQDQNGKGSLSGFKYYPYSDFAAYQTHNFSFFLKTISTRTLPSEVGLNSENLKGALLNSGDGYLIRNGNEYYNIVPLWNWNRLPGITTFNDAKSIKRKAFVGAVSDGFAGLNAMDYRIENNAHDRWISAHKIWACYDNLVIALVAGVDIHGISDSIYTVMEQSWLQGPVTIYPGGRLGLGVHVINGLRSVTHAGFAYIPITPKPVMVSLLQKEGTWASINASESDSLIRGKIFTAQFLYGDQAIDISGGYVLAYTGSARKTRKLLRRHPWRVLRNDTACQAVRFSDGAMMAAFFSAGSLHEERFDFGTDRPCLAFFRGHKLYLSDPTHVGGEWRISLNGRLRSVTLPRDGTSVELYSPLK